MSTGPAAVLITAIICCTVGAILLHLQELRHQEEKDQIWEYCRNAMIRHVTRGGRG